MALTDFLKKKEKQTQSVQATETSVQPQRGVEVKEKTGGFLSKLKFIKPKETSPVQPTTAIPGQEIALDQSKADEKPKILDPNKEIAEGKNLLDVLAPKTLEIDFDFFKINEVYYRTLFISGYPRFVSPGWLEQIINFDSSLDVSFFIYPVEAKGILEDLRHKIAEMEAEIATDLERGRIVNATTQAKLDDASVLQEELVKGAEHFYEFAFYITIPARDLDDLNDITKQVQATLGSLLVSAQTATLDMESGFYSTLPFATDRLNITRNMDTTSLSTTFPLTSAELSSDSGVLYGINPLNESFVIFDRYSMENSNMAIFATSGAGKTAHSFTPILYQNRLGQIKLDTLGKIVQTLIKNGNLHKIDDESEGVLNPGIKVFTFDNKLKGKWSNVQVAARKLSPKKLYKITTKSGREIITTGDHNFVVLKNGLIQIQRTDETHLGTYVPLPRQISGVKSNLYFLSARKFVNSWPNCIPDKIPLKKEFLTLLGLITSEGYTSSSTLAIYNSDPQILRIIKIYSKKLGFLVTPICKSTIEKKKVIRGYSIIPNHLAKLVYELGGSGRSGKKRVPGIVFSLHNNEIKHYLTAYFEGDGGVEEHEITATTKSEKLISDLSYLLLRFGIIARIKKTRKAASNTERKTKRTYYRLRISGQDNIRKFITHIGFITKEKNQKAKGLLKKGNTNVDVIPELQPIFREIYDVLYSSSEIPTPKKFSEIKLGFFRPSPRELKKMIVEIEKRVVEFENLDKDGLITLKSLPKVEEILERGKDKTINTKLWQKLGKSWWTIRKSYPPKLKTAIKAACLTHDYQYSQLEVTNAIYRTFKITGESLTAFDYSLWTALINANQNPLYERVINARNYINQKYQEKKIKLQKVKEKLKFLKTLATSDLYWDPIIRVKKIKDKHKYVYDLQVENGVFLAGYGGMFIHNSYFVKLESLRSLMLGTEVIIIDPEAEYKDLSEAVGGQYITFSYSSPSKINPFDLTQVYEEGENQLGLKILSLHSLFKVIMGTLTATQEALLDHALIETYRGKGITQDPTTQTKEPPLMEDLYKTLVGMETDTAMDLAARIEKFVKGSFVGIFDQQTNVEINNPFTVFSVKEVEDALRPVAMFIILDFIWTKVKRDMKRRLLVVDEAWHMMRFEDSAQFMWSIVKRARKYYLGLTTITQDVEDFLSIDIGKAIVTNSALRVLLKQSPAAIDRVGEVFYLSQGEKQLLLGANIGEGIFFAGNHHVPIYIVSSPEEHKLITTRPEELLARRKVGGEETVPGYREELLEEAEKTQKMGVTTPDKGDVTAENKTVSSEIPVSGNNPLGKSKLDNNNTT